MECAGDRDGTETCALVAAGMGAAVGSGRPAGLALALGAARRWGAGQTRMREADPDTSWADGAALQRLAQKQFDRAALGAAMVLRGIPPIAPAPPALDKAKPVPPVVAAMPQHRDKAVSWIRAKQDKAGLRLSRYYSPACSCSLLKHSFFA